MSEVNSSELDYGTIQQLSAIKNLDVMVESLLSLSAYAGNDMISRILNRRNEKRYTWLHTAIFARSLQAVQLFQQFGADTSIKCLGTPCLHLVVNTQILPHGSEFGRAAFSYLLEFCDVVAHDDQGATIAHLLAEYNMVSELEEISRHITHKSFANLSIRLA